MNKVLVLGIGPGSPDYVMPAVLDKIARCDVLVGGNRHLAIYKTFDQVGISLDSDWDRIICAIRERARDKLVGVLVSGDPGLYSLLSVLLKNFKREELDVYPGISSLQYLFARGVLPWQDAAIVSLHGRSTEDLVEMIIKNPKLALLTDKKFPPGEIARYLIERGVSGKRALVGEDLSYPEERIRDKFLKEWVGVLVSSLSVMVIYDE